MQHSLIRTLTKLTFVVALLVWLGGILIPVSLFTVQVSTVDAQAEPPGITFPPPVQGPPLPPRQGPPAPPLPPLQGPPAPPPSTDPATPPSTDPTTPGADPTAPPTQPQPAVQVNPGNTINSYLHAFVVTYVGWFMAHTGAFFDYTFREFVIGFGQNFRTTNTGWAVQQVWGTVRDIFNLTFIFGIIYIGFRLILNGDDSRAKSTLVTLLAAALLVNFSLFITKFVIDVANITATEIAGAVQPITAGDTPGSGGELVFADGGFGELFFNYLGLSSALNVGGSLGVTGSAESGSIDFTNSRASLGYIFGLLLLFLITAFVFLAGAVMVTIRFFVLLIYMIFSPFMFLGWVFPNFAGVSSKWWSGFLGKAFFAPAYVFMLYITLLLMTQYAAGRPRAATDMGALFGSRTVDQAGEAFAYFALVTTSLLASLVIAQKMGATGATTAIAWGKAGANRLGRGVKYAGTQPVKWGARNVVSGAGDLTRGALNRAQTSNNSMARWVASRQVTESLVGGAAAGMQNAKMGTGITQAEKNRKTNASKNAIASRQAVATGLAGQTELNSLRERRRMEELESKVSAGTANGEENAEFAELRAKYPATTALLTPTDISRIGNLEKSEQAMQRAVLDIGTSQLEEMSVKDRNNIAHLLSESQVESLNKSDKLSESDKGKISEARTEAVKKIFMRGNEVISSQLAKLSTHQIETLGDDWINSNSHLLTASQMDEVKKSKKFTESQKNNFVSQRKTGLNNFAKEPNPTTKINNFEKLFVGRKSTDKAQLGFNILSDEVAIRGFIDKDVIDEIVRKKTLSESERVIMKNEITRLAAAGDANATRLQTYLRTPEMSARW